MDQAMLKETRQKQQDLASDGMLRFNRVKPATNVFITLLFIFLAALCLLPVIFVIIISFTSEQSIIA